MNFVERILNNGFERVVGKWEKERGRVDTKFNPKNGWMGVVVFHPVETFVKDNKKVVLSLERFGVTETLVTGNSVAQVKINEKHISIFIDDTPIYINVFGVMPPKEIEEKLVDYGRND